MPIIYSSSQEDLSTGKVDNRPKEQAPLQSPAAKPHHQSKHKYFHSFCVYPEQVSFESQQSDEKVILFLRAHPFTQLPWIISATLGFIFPTFANLFFGPYLSDLQIIFLNLAWHSALLSYIFINLLNWQFNIGLVTNKRIIDIDYHSILYKEINATTIDNVEDVTEKTVGLFSSFFGYGNLFIQTAGTTVNVEFINIPQPMQAVRIINNMMGKKKHG